MEEQQSLSQVAAFATAAQKPREESVVARIPAGQEQSINIRFVKGTRFDQVIPRGCQPRGDRPQTGFDRSDVVAQLSDVLIAKLRQSNDRVINWLSASEVNARLFMENPTAALKEAGVELTRADEKSIIRCREDLSGVAVLPPGTDLKAVSVRAFPKGEVGRIDKVPGRRAGASRRGCVKE